MDYKKILEGVVNIINTTEKSDIGFANICTYIGENCPELKKSEDERIRKEIKDFFSRIMLGQENFLKEDYDWNTWIAWIEKQGENANFFNKIQIGDKVTRNRDGVLVNLSQLNRVAKPAERQRKPAFEMITPEESLGIDSDTYNKIVDECIYGEQKSGDKVESKFKVGDWIVNNNNEYVYQVTKIRDDEYCLCPLDAKVMGYLRIVDIDNDCHLWTIQDAEEGDVLSFDDNIIVMFKDLYNIFTFHSYCYIGGGDKAFYISKDDWWEGKGFKPATKEQRDLLFQKIKEAGYEWNAEKKELKKIEQKSAWSEEDEYILSRIINDLKFLKNTISIDPNYIVSITDIEREINWFESLKDRIQLQTKQEWSKRDELMLEASISFIKSSPYPYFGDTLRGEISKIEAEDWIKYLKERYTWKPSDEH